MAIKFPLKMRGMDVRNLEDLRKNFELGAMIEYFKDGRLIQWLKARYHDDTAAEVSALDENAPDFRERLCAIFGVEFNEEFSRDDGGIVYEMLQWNENDTLAADEKNYTPISISSSAPGLSYGLQNINNYGLSFVDELRKRFKETFKVKSTWWILDADGKLSESDPTPEQKKMFIKRICGKGYSEKDLIHLRAMKDLSAGWAFTETAFCIDGEIKHCLNMNDYKNFKRALLYSDITSVNFSDVLTVEFKVTPSKVDFFEIEFENTFHKDFFGAEIIRHIGQFLNFVVKSRRRL